MFIMPFLCFFSFHLLVAQILCSGVFSSMAALLLLFFNSCTWKLDYIFGFGTTGFLKVVILVQSIGTTVLASAETFLN